MANAAQVLKDKMGGLTDEQKINMLHTLFGNDAMKVGNLLMQDGAAGIDAMREKMADANGVLATAQLMHEGYNTALENAKGSVEALQIRIGEALLPVLTKLLNDYIAPGINSITKFAESFSKMIPAITASDDPLQTFLNALKVAAPDLLDVISGIEKIKDAISPAVVEIKRLADAFGQGGLGGFIDALSTDIAAALPDIQAQLATWGQAFVDWIAPMIPPLLGKLADLAAGAWEWVKAQAPGWGEQLKAWGSELIGWIAPMIPPALAELGKLSTQFLGWIGEQAAPLLKKLNDWATAFVAWIPGATVTFLAEWPKMLDRFLDWVGNSAGPLLKQLGDWSLSFISWIAPMIPPFLVALGGVAVAVLAFVVETAATLSKKIIDTWLPAIVGWIITDAIPALGKALNSFLKVFDDWIKDAQMAVGGWVVGIGKSIVQGIQKGIEDAWGSLSHWLSGKIKSLFDVGQEAQDGGSPAMIWTPAGASIVQGIMLGIEETWPQLTDQIGGLAKGLVDKMQDIGQQMQDIIIDSFGATASIDRQMAKNFDRLGDLGSDFLADYVQQSLAAEQKIAESFADPSAGAAYFKMVSDNIFETAALQKKIGEAQTQDEKDRLQAQYELISRAQEAERSKFDAEMHGQQSPAQVVAASINDLLGALTNINLTDSQIAMTGQLATWLDALGGVPHRAKGGPVDASQPYWIGENGPELFWPSQDGYVSPPASAHQMAARANTTNYYGNVGPQFSMPIYTNQSPQVVQQSLALAQASMP
jgi:hypothetical protein